MRLFFGLPVAPAEAIRIADWRERMLPPMDHPVPMANFHITLAFLGEVSPARREALEAEADRVFADRFELSIDELGYFSRPGILWLGPRQPAEPLMRLQRELDAGARRARVRTEERPYQPHITLARRCRTPPPASTIPPDMVLSFDHFALFESVMGQGGVRYHPLTEWPLA